MPETPIVELRDVWKRFGSTQALAGAGLSLAPNEIHALLGENGAGKSTLMRVLYGLVRPDRGEVRVRGERVELRGPRHALALGIGLVHQHFMGVPALSVAENLVLGEPGGLRLGPAELRAEAEPILAQWRLDVDPDAPVATLPVAQQQRLEIARALASGARVLVLDEPTAVLAPPEIEALLELLDALRGSGHAVVFISHKLEEIRSLCDRVTVLRAGANVGTREVAGMSADEIGRWMVGEALPPAGAPPGAAAAEVALRVRGLRAPGLDDIDFELRAGEVLALAGIDGNGQRPLEEVLAGVLAPDGGDIEVCRPPLALLSADRQRTGLVLDLPLGENLVLPEAAVGGRPPVFRRGWLRPAALRAAARAAIERFDIRAGVADEARALSGGNQQKLCVARALREAPGVLVAVNPTRGLDVASTAAVREELRAQARAGTAVLLISTELDEVLELGDRIGVLFRGRVLPVPPAARHRDGIGARMLGREDAA